MHLAKLIKLQRKVTASARKPAGDACHTCPLRKATCVLPEINPEAKVVVVGEAPGGTEVAKGRPFIGPSGHMMSALFERIGLSREEVHWTNAVLCEPPMNQKLFKQAQKSCAERLRAELDASPAGLVVPVGAFGLQSAIRWPTRPSILSWRGTVIAHGAKMVMPTIHPAFVLRDELWRPVISADFFRIQRVLEHGFVPPEGGDNMRTVIGRTPERIEANLAKMGKTVAVDVETLGLRATITKMLSVGISDGERTLVIPWRKRRDGLKGLYFGDRTKEVAELLSAALKKRVMVTHNGPVFDHVVLNKHGVTFDKWEDTLLAHHSFASHMPQNLMHVASMYLDIPPWKHQREASFRDLLRYNAQDVIYTKQTWARMQGEVEEERAVYEESKRTAEVCRQMQFDGVRFDQRRAKLISAALDNKATALHRKIRRQTGDFTLNANSTKQLKEVLFERFKVPVLAESEKTGEPSLDVNVLRAYAAMHDSRLRELVTTVLELRNVIKTRGTYVDRIVWDRDGRVHPSWKNYGACTGRWSCAAPNLMNLTKEQHDPSIHLGGVRSLWIPARGHVFVAFDCKQIEMRIAAYWSGDPVMIAACESVDLHAANAELIFGEEFRQADPALRKVLRDIAKQSGFAVAYLADAETVYARIIAEGLPIELKLEAVVQMLETLRRKFKVYFKAQSRSYMNTVRSGTLRIPLSGRVRVFGHEPKTTEVANTPIQGGAAAVMTKTILALMASPDRPVSKLVAQVHDSVVFEVEERRADELKAFCIEMAQRPIDFNGRSVVFPVDADIGDSMATI